MSDCAMCGGSYEVIEVTPDMDIKPVPLCILCRVEISTRPIRCQRMIEVGGARLWRKQCSRSPAAGSKYCWQHQ